MTINDVLTRDELAALTARSNWRAAGILTLNYLIMAGAFALAIAWPNPLTIIAAIVVLGARQLGLEVLNHDCAHSVFFAKRRVNEVIGNWLCGGPVNTNLYRYRDYHLKHHRFAGTKDDPDLQLALTYPAPKESVIRKFTRDLTGRTGLRDTWRQIRRMRPRRNAPFFVTHIGMLTILTAVGAPWAYLLWWAGYIFIYPAVTRLRFMGEHGVATDRLSSDARENTSTTLLSWWERLLIGPNRVNYHLEHHLLASVPLYRLKSMHELLKARGYYDGFNCLSAGYPDVVRRAVAH